MDKKVLRWNFIFQYGWVLTNIINSILLLPIYLANIDIDTLGVWLVTGNILGWMTLVDPGVGEILQQRIAENNGRDEKTEVQKTIGSGLISSGAIVMISIILGFLFYVFIGKIIDKDIAAYPHLSSALIISIIATALTLVSFSTSGINQGLHNSAQVAICSLSSNFLFLILNLIFLFMGYGVLSIALANLFRALYINVYNLLTLSRFLKKRSMKIFYEWNHFRSFIRIFSVTSASKIITGISYSIEMIVLGRYISPAMITVYEINKRPINITYSLIGRHSVALMPLISHSKGQGDKAAIINLINKQFRIYCYAALFACFIFLFNYENLIAAWTGPGKFVGNLLISLLVLSFFVSLVSYFLAIIGYALGDIKMNSLYNIIRNIFFGILMFFAARYFGIQGTVMVSIAVAFFADLFFYSYRLHKMGYLQVPAILHSVKSWLLVIPVSLAAGWGLNSITAQLISPTLYFTQLLINGVVFSLFYVMLLLVIDRNIRTASQNFARKYVLQPISRLRRA